VFSLTKTSMTTPDALGHFGKALGARGAAVDYAGLKDKHAQTRQHVSFRADGEPPPDISGHNWSATLLGWSAEPMAAPVIEGNRFTIVIRGIAKETSQEMDRRAALLAEAGEAAGPGQPRRLVIANYFGAQRFGSARHGKGFVAIHLMRGEFEQALRLAIGTPARKDMGKTREFTRMLAAKWGEWAQLAGGLPRCPERKAIELLASRTQESRATEADFREAFGALPYFQQTMVVEAFQSELWNRTAHGVIAGSCVDPPPLKSDDQFGEMLFPAVASIRQGIRALQLPLLAPGVPLTDPWRASAAAALAEHGLELADLRIPGVRRPYFGSADRSLFVEARDFLLTPAEPDEFSSTPARRKRVARFTLPRGAYATVVLRALGQ
jgi:tRNA pseudouridine13 synthase